MANLAQGWINHLRRQAKSDQAAPAGTEEVTTPSPLAKDQPWYATGNDKADDLAPRIPSSFELSSDYVTPARKRLKSPTNSIKADDRTRSPSPMRRSKYTTADQSTADFPARPTARKKGRLWNEGDPILTRKPQSAPQQHTRPSRRRDNNKVRSQSVEEEDPSLEYDKTQANTYSDAHVLMTAILPESDPDRHTFMRNSTEDKPTPHIASEVFPGDRFESETFDENEMRFEHLPLPEESRGRATQIGSEDRYFRFLGSHSEAFDNLQSPVHVPSLSTPRDYLIPLSLLSNIPRRFQYLAVLTYIAIPIVAANVGIMEWAFGILAIIPSTYVLANPPVPPTVNDGAEAIVWKYARDW
ncbi:hypothetical protein Daus18300_008014 [Diaporthe australafricana]|uniref:Uncharacterized protein n=1 Tax=Diaporthe australafricana TaxID=127596 RepID=A0ABR3WK61_9PEZI